MEWRCLVIFFENNLTIQKMILVRKQYYNQVPTIIVLVERMQQIEPSTSYSLILRDHTFVFVTSGVGPDDDRNPMRLHSVKTFYIERSFLAGGFSAG